jgi:RHS repeat-associated protein
MTFKEGTDEPYKEQAMDYSPYGGVFWRLDYRDRQRDSWVGKEKDRESGLGDHGVRKYDHLIGRFNSIDPLWSNFISQLSYI